MKLTIIGGAGVRTPLFIDALVRRAASLSLTEVTLMDIDEEKLGLIGALCTEVVRRAGNPFILQQTTDARAALAGASFVVTTIRVGFEAGRVLDERIALRHGVLGQETTGPGGFAMALRSIPAILDYAALMEEVCPSAWLLNFTNPAGLVAQAIALAHPGLRVAGICDTPPTMQRELARVLRYPLAELEFKYFGLNHLSWIGAVTRNGEDLLPALIGNEALLRSLPEFPFDPALIRLIGLIPNEYLYYYYYRERAVANLIAAKETRGEEILKLNQLFLKQLRSLKPERNPTEGLAVFHSYIRSRQSTYMMAETGVSQQLHAPDDGGEGYAGVALAVASAVVSGASNRVVLNVRNGATLPTLHPDDVIEAICSVDAAGAHPEAVVDVPEHALSLIEQVKRYERLTVQAITTRCRDTAVKALMAHPLVGSYSLATALVDDYLQAHRAYVGDWH